MAQYTEFEGHVIDSLARMETKMDDLVGINGKPGRMKEVETKIYLLTVGLIVLAIIVLGPHAMPLIAGLLH